MCIKIYLTISTTITMDSEPKTRRERFEANKANRKAYNAQTRQPPPTKKVREPEPVVILQKTCAACNITFTTDNKWSEYCDKCSRANYFRSNIAELLVQGSASYRTNDASRMPLAENFYTDHKIRLEFEITLVSHDGYCSDHDYSDVKTETRKKIITAKLFRDIKNKDFDPDTNIVTNTVLLNNLYRPKYTHKCNCVNGICQFTILSGTIFKVSDIIILDD